MTFHNLADNASQLIIADVGSTCTAQVNSNCEAGADYVWYTIGVFTPPQDEQKKTAPITLYFKRMYVLIRVLFES
jgi:hypothetical protein